MNNEGKTFDQIITAIRKELTGGGKPSPRGNNSAKRVSGNKKSFKDAVIKAQHAN
jgi:hypothetical protein